MPQRPRRPPPRKAKLGQNFLVSPTAPSSILEALGDLSSATVLEIGPGKGALTRLLAARSHALVAVELDPALAELLRKEFAHRPSIDVRRQDILNVDLTALASQYGWPLRVVGNLPYYITSEILLHLFRHHAAIECAVLMVQREVADRIAASPGGRDYGLLSATTQMHAGVEALFSLPPEAFSPPPEVYSTVIRLTMRPRFAELGVEPGSFFKFLRYVFAQKRKTLANNLHAAGLDANLIRRALAECNLDPLIRAEAVPLETMACLFHVIERMDAAVPR